MPQHVQRASGAATTGAASMTEQESAIVFALEAIVGRRFAEPHLLLEALTHRSFAYESAATGTTHNERLEFLGDAVLGFVAADLTFARVPQADEGRLTTLRAALIRTTTLARFAHALRLGRFLRVGRGHAARDMGDRVWASTFEAIVGALYCDGGIEAARAFLNPLLVMELEHVLADSQLKDDKTRLQDLAQTRLGITPQYRIVAAEGPAHEPQFVVEVVLDDRVVGQGTGGNKRQAEQAAAKKALEDPGWQTPPAEGTEPPQPHARV